MFEIAWRCGLGLFFAGMLLGLVWYLLTDNDAIRSVEGTPAE